jgi:hypothetical protein
LAQTEAPPTDEKSTEDYRRNWIQKISEKDMEKFFTIADLSIDSCYLAPANA